MGKGKTLWLHELQLYRGQCGGVPNHWLSHTKRFFDPELCFCSGNIQAIDVISVDRQKSGGV